jgi:hypothetical protein
MTMLRCALFVIAVCLCLESFGQPGVSQNVSTMRIVNGKLYNARYSTNWTVLPKKKQYIEMTSPIKGGLMFIETGDVGENDTEPGLECVIKNFPNAKTITTGQKFYMPIFVMRVGVVDLGGRRLPLYDFGVPYTGTNAPTN